MTRNKEDVLRGCVVSGVVIQMEVVDILHEHSDVSDVYDNVM